MNFLNGFYDRGFETRFSKAFNDEQAMQELGQRVKEERPFTAPELGNAFTQAQAVEAVAPMRFGAPQLPQGGTPPINPNAPDPRRQQPQPQQQSSLNTFLNSPSMAMASAAANGIFAGRKDQRSVDPIQAYQQAVQNQSIMKMRKATAAQQAEQAEQRGTIGEQTIKLNEQKLDPFFEYNEAKRTQVIPPDMSYAEFQKLNYRSSDLTAPQKHLAQAEAMQREIAAETDPARKKALEDNYGLFQEFVRKSDPYSAGGGSHYVRRADGSIVEVVSANDAIDNNKREKEVLTRAETLERAQATQDAEFRTAGAAIPDVEAALQDTRDLRDQIKSGQFEKTGFFEGRFTKFTDQKSAELQGKAVMQALKNLQITNLAPVTEAEIALIMDLYASVLKDPQANLGALDNAIDLLEKKIALHDKMEDHWMANNYTLRDYGINARYNKRTATMQDDADQGLIDGPERTSEKGGE